MVLQTFRCVECGKTVTKEFPYFKADRLVCSKECRRNRYIRLRREKTKDPDPVSCPICGKSFIKKAKNQKFCSIECRKLATPTKEPKKVKKQMSDLAEVNQMARKQGLTYGMYVGLTEHGRLGFQRERSDF